MNMRTYYRYQRIYLAVFLASLVFFLSYITSGSHRKVPHQLCDVFNPSASLDRDILYPDQNQLHFTSYELIEHIVHNFNKTKTILVAYVEYSYIELAMNFYYTSLLRWKINNYIMISSDIESCNVLNKYNINCIYDKTHVLGTGVSSRYGSTEFKMKTHAKTRIVRDILKVGYQVWFSDIDIVFLQNPLQYLKGEAEAHDILIQVEGLGGDINSGFYIANPTPETVFLFSKVCECEAYTTEHSEQKLMVHVLKTFRKSNLIREKHLDYATFAAGNAYWEDEKIMFNYDNPWNDMANDRVIIHNNWIVGKPAKIYRFKESNMWRYDENGYYSNKDARYISFQNPLNPNAKMNLSTETRALQSALAIGFLLNRIVILPKFHCFECSDKPCLNAEGYCSLLAHYSIEQFDKYFANKYREHVFESNPLTPKSVTISKSKVYLIRSSFARNALAKGSLTKDTAILNPMQPDKGASSAEILEWFKDEQHSILRFHSLYEAYQLFDNDTQNQEINERLQQAFVRSTYRQY